MRTSSAESEAVGELEFFRQYIRQLANGQRPSDLTRNRDRQHASIVVAEIFRIAHAFVKILTGTLHPAVYGTDEAVTAALDFLKRWPHGKIEILTENDLDSNHPLIAKVRETIFVSNVSVWKVPKDVQTTYKSHFCVADGQNYRYEKCREAPGEGFVRFGDAMFAKKLDSIFERVKSQSTTVVIDKAAL